MGPVQFNQRNGDIMSADTATKTTHRTGIRTACGVFIIGTLVLAGAMIAFDAKYLPAAANTVVASANPADDWSASASKCAQGADVYRLAEPGTYSAFASTPSGAAVVEIRDPNGEMLATSRSTVAKPVMVDLLTGVRFGVAPPPLFEVNSSVLIHVQQDGSPYELVVVRIDGGQGWSDVDVHPPVEAVISDWDSCLTGSHSETMRIRTDAVYSAVDARQVFRLPSPTPSACGTGTHRSTAIFVNVFGCRQFPRFTPAEPMPAEMVISPVRGL